MSEKLEDYKTDGNKEVIELCKKGNSKGQLKLYELYSKSMFNVCLRMMKTREEAEDVLQESFVEIFKHIDSFRYDSTIGAWIKKIVINRCINALKKKSLDIEYKDNNSLPDKPETNTDESEWINMTVDKIKKAVSELSEGYRVIFSLYVFEGYDHAEISEVLGISESTSKSQYLRAKRRIAELLQKN